MNLNKFYHLLQKYIDRTKESDIIIQKYTVKDSRDLLNYLVDQKLTEWRIYNLDPKTDNYMTEEKAQDAIEYIIKRIILEMTPTTKVILGIGFPMSDEQEMIESIKNWAKLSVLNYVIEQNTFNEASESIPNIKAF